MEGSAKLELVGATLIFEGVPDTILADPRGVKRFRLETGSLDENMLKLVLYARKATLRQPGAPDEVIEL